MSARRAMGEGSARLDALDVPGMDVALACPPAGASGRPAFADVRRCGPNAWAVVAGTVDGPVEEVSAVPELVLTAAASSSGASAALRASHDGLLERGAPDRRAVAELVLVLVELDRCGAWVTIACAGEVLPILLRRAGWMDVRGQAGPLLGLPSAAEPGEDRVGLGPGDALVVVTGAVARVRDSDGERFGEERLPSALLRHPGAPAVTVADAVADAALAHAVDGLPSGAAVLVIAVPPEADTDPDGRLQAALDEGGDAVLPGYPVGEPHWSPDVRPAPPREARLAVRSERRSVPRARRFVEGLLRSWRMDELLDGDVELVTSELVGNAVQHARSLTTVLVSYDGRRVRIAVGDGSRGLPQNRAATSDDLGGRGLQIIESLADAWGVTPTVDGKRVWAEVDVPPRPDA